MNELHHCNDIMHIVAKHTKHLPNWVRHHNSVERITKQLNTIKKGTIGSVFVLRKINKQLMVDTLLVSKT